jgi:hypothetical protein
VPGQATATLRMTIRWWGLRRVIAGPGRTSGAELASDHWLVADAEGKRGGRSRRERRRLVALVSRWMAVRLTLLFEAIVKWP